MTMFLNRNQDFAADLFLEKAFLPRNSVPLLFQLILFVQVNPPSWGNYSRSEFIIHGLWPEYKNSSYPEYCCHERICQYNSSKINDLKQDLRYWWTNFRDDPEKLWKHEWNKHGTCSNLTEREYFSKGLEWRSEYPAKEILKQSNLYPGKKYKLDSFIEKIQKYLGFRLIVTCKHNLLEQLILCNIKDKMVDCPLAIKNNCPEIIFY